MTRFILSLLFAASLCPAARAADADPAASMPADAAVFVTIRDVRALLSVLAGVLRAQEPDDPNTKAVVEFFDRLGSVATGRLAFGSALPPKEGDEWRHFFVVPVDESKRKLDDAILEPLRTFGGGQVDFAAEGGIRRLTSPDGSFRLFWTVEKGVLYFSNVREYVEAVLNPPPKPVPTLGGTQPYQRLAKHIDWSADAAAFVDLGKVAWRNLLPDPAVKVLPPHPGDWVTSWLKFDQFEAAGLSLKGDGKSASIRLAVLTAADRKGLAAVCQLPDSGIKYLDRIPENCQLFLATAPLWRGLSARLAQLMRELDPDVGKEFDEDLAEFNKDLGIDVEKDLLSNVGSITAGLRMPGAGDLALFSVLEIADKARFDKCANALADYNKTPLRKVDRNGRPFCLLPVVPAMGYTFDGDQLYFSNSFDAVEGMFALRQRGTAAAPGPSLADSDTFSRLRKRLPEKAALFAAADAHWAASALSTFILLNPDARKEADRFNLNKLLEPLLEADPGLSIGLALRSEPDALVLHVESLAGDPLLFVPRAFAAVGADARDRAQRARSMNNLKNLAVAAIVVADADGARLFPPSLKALHDSGKVEDPDAFLCPGSGSTRIKDTFVCDYESAFERATFRISDEKVPVELVMVWEKKTFFGAGRNVVYFDGHVEWLPEADFQKQLKKLDDWTAANKPK